MNSGGFGVEMSPPHSAGSEGLPPSLGLASYLDLARPLGSLLRARAIILSLLSVLALPSVLCHGKFP